MQQTRRLLAASMTTLGALALVGASFTGTAGATGSHGKGPAHDRAVAGQAEHRAADRGQHGKADEKGRGDRDGDADRARAARFTEDDDTNDAGTPNNVVDHGDDRHPSGRDRSVEKGRSGNQGKAGSDPDDDGRGPDRSNGGPDKPNGAGGIDKADQDGNNGCGNDDDFEDDNEGWCGRNPERGKAEQPSRARAAQRTPAKAERRERAEVAPTEPARAEHAPPSPPADAPCPAGMVDTDGDATGGCNSPAVFANGTEICPGGTAMGIGCDVPMGMPARVSVGEEQPAAIEGEVLAVAASAGAPSSPDANPSLARAAVGGVAGALAFTGGDVFTLVLAALLAVGVGGAMLWADRRRNA